MHRVIPRRCGVLWLLVLVLVGCADISSEALPSPLVVGPAASTSSPTSGAQPTSTLAPTASTSTSTSTESLLGGATATPSPPIQAEGSLVFATEQEGDPGIYYTRRDIVLSNVDGSDLLNLTEHPADDHAPIWSPDGSLIAFWSDRDRGGQVYIMRADGSEVRPVANTGLLDMPVDWSPDGEYLLLTSREDVQMDVYSIRVDGSSRLNLTHQPAEDHLPQWAPDGSRIAFGSEQESTPDGTAQIFLMSPDGADRIQLTHGATGASYPVWSPDSQSLAISVWKPGGAGSDIFVIDDLGATLRQMTHTVGWNIPLTWSSDGRYLLTEQIANIRSTPTTVVISLDGTTSWNLPNRMPEARWQPKRELTALRMVPTPSLSPTPEPTPETLAFVAGTLIDGTGADPIVDAVIVIRDGRIVAVGHRDRVVVLPDARVIDVQGSTLLPGFINAHVHGATWPANLAAWAQAGVTTVRDLGTPLDPTLFAFRDATLVNPTYARVLAAGPIVTVPGGYPIARWGADLALQVRSEADARQKVTALLDAGADVVKIAITGSPVLSPAELAVITDVAHASGTRVTAHVDLASDLEAGLAAGIDDAAHMVINTLSDELIKRLVADDIYIVPTLAVLEAYARGAISIENVRRFVAAGGKIALGDDYGNPGSQLGMPIPELEMMQAAGMTPMQIIVAGTLHAATVCAMEQDIGSLEPGKIADILIVDGNPLEDLQQLTNVRMVLRDGKIIRQGE